jgi:hypothetical protein
MQKIVGLLLIAFATACSGSSSSSASPSSATTVTTAPPGAALPVSTNGCAATYACASTDANGVPNPSTPTFDQLTLSNGTSSSCRASLHRNTPDPGIPFQVTIRNTQQFGYSWRPHNQTATGTDPSLLAITPGGSALAGSSSISATAFFNSAGLGPLSTGLNFTQNLVIDIISTGPGSNFFTAPAVATCGVTVWGTVPSGL